MSRASTLRYQRRGPGGPTAKYTGVAMAADVVIYTFPEIVEFGYNLLCEPYAELFGWCDDTDYGIVSFKVETRVARTRRSMSYSEE